MPIPTHPSRTWDLFCRVIDNLGDTGVCWRLCADLAERGETVRLWIDDASALAWMAPHGAPRVTVHDWHAHDSTHEASEPGDVVIEAFGCELPEAFIARMASRPQPPLWVNLEYLSAEAYVERNHRLRSPQSHGAGAGMTKWFFYPGFTKRTGGLTRERGLMRRRAAFDASQWLGARGLLVQPSEQVVSLFCYAQPALPALLNRFAAQPTLLLCAPGAATEQVTALLGPALCRGGLRAVAMPWLSQPEYDHQLWSSDLNFVRGEDSFVRAQWAGAPFVWQAYPQGDGAHHEKIDAFLARHLHAMPAALAASVSVLWDAWNGNSDVRPAGWPAGWPDTDPWAHECNNWRAGLLAQADLASQLIELV